MTGIDGDAEAARQLHHSMTMSRVGAAIEWEETLKALGIDVSKDVERVHLQEQWDREWKEVMMDSVKRKRKRKMKKHKWVFFRACGVTDSLTGLFCCVG